MHFTVYDLLYLLYIRVGVLPLRGYGCVRQHGGGQINGEAKTGTGKARILYYKLHYIIIIIIIIISSSSIIISIFIIIIIIITFALIAKFRCWL